MDKEQSPLNNGFNRQSNGRFGPGNIANPNGRPRGSGISITTEIKKKLEEIPEGHKKSYLQKLVDSILRKAIIDGDATMQTKIWNYIDGMPKQDIKFNGDLDIEVARKQAIPDNVRDAAWIALKSWGIIPEDEELPKIETENGKNIQQPKPEPECRSLAVIQQSAE